MFSLLREASHQGTDHKPMLIVLLLDSTVHFISNIYRCYFQFSNRWIDLEGAGLCEPFTPIECLTRSLKIIELQPYEGCNSHIEFAKFFIKNAKALQLMKFNKCICRAVKWIKDQHRQLDIENKASTRAQFSFEFGNFSSTFWLDGALSEDACF
jgi:hypothetical protein